MRLSLAFFAALVFPNVDAIGDNLCGARKLTRKERRKAKKMIGEYRLRVHSSMAKQVPVHWHSVRVGGQGDTDKQIEDSIKVLNDSFGGKFQFTLASKRVSTSSQDWDIDYHNDRDHNLKSGRKGECNALNVYSTKLKGGLLGYANYPTSCGKNKQDDGVMIGYGTVPGGGSAPYNLGDTLTHEVGHWLNLAHTFEGGCSGNGDGVDDTPAVKQPNFGCPRNTNSCPGGGNDLIQNFMDYTDDSCMDSFTNGQYERALAAWEKYRERDDDYSGTYFIRSAHGTQIRIYPYNKVDMTVNQQSWEKTTIVPVGNNQYALKSAAHGNRYLKVNGSGASKLVDTQTFVGSWEKFYVEKQSNGKVAFKSAAWGNYLRAHPGNPAKLDTQTGAWSWEQFNLIPIPDFSGTYFIRSAHGTHIRIYNYNKVDVTTNTYSWEKITIKPVGNDQYALKSAAHGNRYLKVNGSGASKLVNTQTFVGSWEKFYVEKQSNGKVAFKSAAWGNYLRAHPGNPAKLDTQTGPWSWEQFNLIRA